MESRNQELESKRIYLMGICGTGMAALAGLLKEQGYHVSGSDTAFYPPMGEVIVELGIKPYNGWDPANIDDFRPDMVVIGNVIRRENPEAQHVMEKGIPYISFPEALGRFYLADRRSLVAAGTHGKTTTATLMTSALEACGEDAGFLIGGVPIGKGRGFHCGRGDWFVIEGDEYDTAFFDKVSKFMHYRPFGVVLTSIEFDHADIFPDFQAVKQAFQGLVRIVPADGVIAACSDWPAVEQVVRQADAMVVTYGLGDDCLFQAADIHVDEKGTEFTILKRSKKEAVCKLQMPGRHNALNALGVYALLTALGLPGERVVQGLAICQGVMRRQEIRGEVDGITVIDDFAHHPTAVEETLIALKEQYRGRRLIAVFEPRTNTSRRAIFQDRYARAFGAADLVLVRDVPDPEKAPDGDRFSSEKLVEELRGMGQDALFFSDARAIVDFIRQNARSGDLYAVLSNGPFEGIHQKILYALNQRNRAGQGLQAGKR